VVVKVFHKLLGSLDVCSLYWKDFSEVPVDRLPRPTCGRLAMTRLLRFARNDECVCHYECSKGAWQSQEIASSSARGGLPARRPVYIIASEAVSLL
jgi:hypothetical protein